MLGQSFTLPGQAPGVASTRLCHLLADEALLRRLSGNTSEDCVSALRSLSLPDSFWTDEFKVVPCAKTYSHKWTLCPCAHIGETARRRCPRTVNYKAVLCPLVKAKKTCPLGDNCSYAHNVFEQWLHPSRYKTRLCSFGRNCNRSICFFAHSAEELRCVPCTDDKEGDEREYLMQILIAQENGLLPATALEPVPPAPMPPLLPGMLPDLSTMLQQALQQPLPPSARSSVNGMPPEAAAAAAMMSARPSMNGVDHMAASRASMPGLPTDAAAAMFRASMNGLTSGMHEHHAGGAASAMMRARPSMNGLPDRSASAAFPAPRSSMPGLANGGFPRARPSINGLADNAATAKMLLSMSAVQQDGGGGMQRAMSSELGVGVGLRGAIGMAAAVPGFSMQRDLSSGQLNVAAAAMERAMSRELAAAAATTGPGSISPVQPSHADGGAYHHPAMQQQQREMAGTNSGPLERVYGGATRRDLSSLGQAPSINSTESDSLLQVRVGGGGMGGVAVGSGGSAVLGSFGADGGALGFDALGNPQAPARLSDPGSNFQMAAARGGGGGGMAAGIAAHHARVSDSGNKMGLLCSKDLHGLESLLPLMNNALATGALGMPQVAAGDFRRSNSGSNNSGRGQSPQLQEQHGRGANSPSHSGSLTPLSSNSAGEVGAMDGPAAAGMVVGATGSPPRGPHDGGAAAAAFEGMYLAAAAAAGGGLHPGLVNLSRMLPIGGGGGNGGGGIGIVSGGGGGGGGVDQSYLSNLVARLRDQGVNKDQLVSSLSQLLAQLLSVS